MFSPKKKTEGKVEKKEDTGVFRNMKCCRRGGGDDLLSVSVKSRARSNE